MPCRLLLVVAASLGLLLLLSAPAPAAAAANSSPAAISAPIFAWSSSSAKGCFSGGDEHKPHVEDLKVHSGPDGILQQLLTASSSHEAADKPQVLLAVLGSELKTSHLRNRAMQTVLQPLKALLDASTASLSAPYVLHQAAADREAHAAKLQQLAADKQIATTVVGCSQGDTSSLSDALQQHTEGPQLVVLCTQPPTSPAHTGSPEAVAAELHQLQDAHDTVARLGRHQTTIYAAVPDASPLVARQLLGVAADAGSCGQLCQTQVKWLEGILAALILATAAFSGMCCLYMLDTPTRFEKAKEGSRNE